MTLKPARWARIVERAVGRNSHSWRLISSTPHASSWPKTWAWIADPWVLGDVYARSHKLYVHPSLARVILRADEDMRGKALSQEAKRLLRLPEDELTYDLVYGDAVYRQLQSWEQSRFLDLAQIYAAVKQKCLMDSICSTRDLAQNLADSNTTEAQAADRMRTLLGQPYLSSLQEFTP